MNFKSMNFQTGLIALLMPFAAHADGGYSVYPNARFGFSVEISTQPFTPQGESDAGVVQRGARSLKG